ncbi:MAG: hypothetical protein L0H94_04415 [Nitrospira sp.]|nr:hypothetical protein [Nitrospira sp.]
MKGSTAAHMTTTKKMLPKRHAAEKTNSRIGLLVVGMHRSGTSAVEKTINLLVRSCQAI